VTRFLHTADWQLGLAARHVAGAGDAVRAARLDAVARLLEAARREAAEFVIVAGDLFEDNQVSDELVHRTLRLLGEAAPLPVLLLPGNHDCLGPASVYARPAFSTPPGNVRVLDRAEPREVRPGVHVLPAPLSARGGRADPTAAIEAQRTCGGLRIGVAHGSLRIEGKHGEEDFPIALDAARRLDLDYLALGHWHSLLVHDGHTVYPGTPEPTGFGERDSGNVALVELAPGSPPAITPLRVACLEWLTWSEEAGDGLESLAARVKEEVARLPRPGSTLLRLTLAGAAPARDSRALADLEAYLRSALLYAELDASGLGVRLDDARLAELCGTHPLLRSLVGALDDDAAAGALGLDAAERAPDALREARLLLARLVEEVWGEEQR
jgi:DNA repair exonuclease SbcCD nuclease subunit